MESPSIRVGSREIVVEQTPLRAGFFSIHNPFALRLSDDGLLVEIKNHPVVRLKAWILCGLSGAFLLPALLLAIDHLVQPGAVPLGAVSLPLFLGSVLGLPGVALLGPRYRFDASNRLLTIRHVWRTRRRTLTNILAVQVIDTWVERKGRHSDAFKVPSYQLNLILDDPGEPRLFVAHNEDKKDMVIKAKILADFLGVPLLAVPKVGQPETGIS